METELSFSHEGSERYFILINSKKQTCSKDGCGCTVFGKSGDDHVCNACGNTLQIPDLICISCHEKIECNDHDGLFDSDNCWPYCTLCFKRLPEELKPKL